MRGYELDNARATRRRELTRAWEADHPGQALTRERLGLFAADYGVNNRVRLIQEALLVRQLGNMGISDAELREAFRLDVDGLHRQKTRPLTAPTADVQKIEDQVLAEIPETPEPDRYVPAPTGPSSTERRWDARAALIDQEIATRAAGDGRP